MSKFEGRVQRRRARQRFRMSRRERGRLQGAGGRDFFRDADPGGNAEGNPDLLHREIVKAVNLPDVKARHEGLGLDVVANSQKEFGAQIKQEIVKLVDGPLETPKGQPITILL